MEVQVLIVCEVPLIIKYESMIPSSWEIRCDSPPGGTPKFMVVWPGDMLTSNIQPMGYGPPQLCPDDHGN